MEFKSLRNIESSFRQIRLFGIVFLSLCAVVTVLAEEMDDQKDGYVTGRMDNNSIVHFPGTEDMIGNIYNVKLDECRGFYYMGEIKEDA